MRVNGVCVLLTIWIVYGQSLKQLRAKTRPGTTADCTIVDEALKIVALFDHSSDGIEAFVNNVIPIEIAN